MESYFENIEYHIKKLLRKANKRCLIALGWFTNIEIAKILLELDNVRIEVLLDDNSINRNSQAVKLLVENHIEVIFINNPESEFSSMHHKFCTIDNEILITGSYNWTKNAKTNNENIIISRDNDSVIKYNLEFSRLKYKGSKFDNDFHLTMEKYESELVDISVKELLKIINKKKHREGALISSEMPNLELRVREFYEKNLTITFQKVKNFSVNIELLDKYHLRNLGKATNEETFEAYNKIMNKKIEDFKREFPKLILQFKLMGLKKIFDSKLKAIEGNITEAELELFDFLTKEKMLMHKTLHNTV